MAKALAMTDLEGAVRAMLADEVARVHGASPVIPEHDGWSSGPDAPSLLPHAAWDAEAWRWFELVDVSIVDAMVVVAFGWAEPGTPELVHIAIAHADGLTSAEARAAVVRQQLRRLLAPGWRERAELTRLGPRTLLVRPPGSTEDAAIGDGTVSPRHG